MLGHFRLVVLAALIIAVGAGFGLALPAGQPTYSLAGNICTGGAPTAAQAIAIPETELDCGPKRFERRDRFVRARIYLSRPGLIPKGDLILQTDPVAFDSLVATFVYTDQQTFSVDIDPKIIVRNWDAGGIFWIPVPRSYKRPASIEMIVEQPRSPALFQRLELVGLDVAARLNYAHTLLYVLVCGILLVPAIFDLMFYRVLGDRSIAWHVVLTLGTLAYVLFNSGLVVLIDPELSVGMRFWGSYVAIAAVVVSAARFSLLILEQDKLPTRLKHWWFGSALLLLAVAALIALDVEALRITIVDIFHLSALPVIGMTVAVVGVAWTRGSRVISFIAIAYSGVLMVGALQLYASLFGRAYEDELDRLFYLALIILVLGTSAVLGGRFIALKADHDRAQLRAVQLDAMANSDGLTGLLNRRAFDQHRRLNEGQALLLIDLDRFKTINDTFGHQRGDAVLVHAADVIKRAVECEDRCQVYRLGGEEFAVLCAAPNEKDLASTAERLRMAIESGGPDGRPEDMPLITVSIGAILGEGQLMHVAFAEADQALYRAKSDGRNRFVLA